MAVSALELRIGNLVDLFGEKTISGINQHTNGLYRVKVSEKTELGYRSEFAPISEINPIPLTEEWLLRFGFKKEESNKWTKEGFFCYLVYGGGNGWKTWVNLTKDDFTLALVGQVHQLQNLYFALTGKELELKPEL